MPDIENKILFIKDDNIIKNYLLYKFDSNLQLILNISGSDTMKPIIFERFDDSCKLNVNAVKKILKDRVTFHMPVIFA